MTKREVLLADNVVGLRRHRAVLKMLNEFSIPQTTIQEAIVADGRDNQIVQRLEQTLIFYVIELPEEIATESLQTFIQTESDEGEGNEIEQQLDQIAPDFPLFANNVRQESDTELSPAIANLIAQEHLNSLQLVTQTADIIGDGNEILQQSEQAIADLFLFDAQFADAEDVAEGDLEAFLARAAGEIGLDALQFAFQDAIVTGNNNRIEQEISQTIETFLLVEDAIADSLAEVATLPPIQFSLQETFVIEESSAGNAVTQAIAQTIAFDETFATDPDADVSLVSGSELETIDFDIDAFLSAIANEIALEAVQKSEQIAVQTGESNRAVQSEAQSLVLRESSELFFGNLNNDTLEAGISASFDGLSDVVFSGAGNDLVDLAGAAAATFFEVPTNARVYGGSGDDELIANQGDRLQGGRGNDLLDASLGKGNNRLDGGAGNDDFFLGSGDRLIGGTGDDRFFVLSGGNNLLTGGEGSDRFWLLNAELPDAANTISDFELGIDAIGIGGVGIESAAELTFSQEGSDTLIFLDGRNFARLLGIQAEVLSAASDAFIFQN